jgi:hypothetical protein
MRRLVQLLLQLRLPLHPLHLPSSVEFRSLQEPSMERASIIDRDQLDKISKKICRAIAPGFLYIDINKLLESATGSAIVQPIQLLQDLYIELNNSLVKTESNEIFYIIDWDATGTITRSLDMITQHVPDLTAQ